MIYLDHAATSWPKPDAVLAAMQRWYAEIGVSAARGASDRCIAAAREVAAVRQALADRAGVRAEHVAFNSGATEGLNLCLRALLQPGDAVLATAFEHSSVVRPLQALARERSLRVHVVPAAAGGVDLDAVRATLQALRPRLFVFTHASNVTGAVLPAAAMCALAREVGALTVLDTSQTAGWIDLRVGADIWVGSGHKALLGPPGIGFLLHRGLGLSPQKQGGTGSSQALAEHPTTWPEAFEAGTPNTPAIYGLGAALAARDASRQAADLATALARLDELLAGLRALPGIRCLAATTATRVPVASFTHAHFDPSELGALLAGASVHVRTGHHCAPWIHASLGTEATGTVRVSTGATTTRDEIARVLEVLAGL